MSQPQETYASKCDLAMAEFEKLKVAIDSRGDSEKQQLQQRTWLLHWSLFVFWNHPKVIKRERCECQGLKLLPKLPWVTSGCLPY